MTMVGAVQTRNRPEAATHMAAIWKNCCSREVLDNERWVDKDFRIVSDMERRLFTMATIMSVLQMAIITNGVMLTKVKAIHGRMYSSKYCTHNKITQ